MIHEILASIFKAKKNGAVVFCFWGEKAKVLNKRFLAPLRQQYPQTKVLIHEFCNPAAQGDLFCLSPENPFTQLSKLVPDIDWLPEKGSVADSNEKRGFCECLLGFFLKKQLCTGFVEQTLALHQALVGRLQDGGHADELTVSQNLCCGSVCSIVI